MDGWDEALREAQEEGEAVVVRGNEIDPIKLRFVVEDPYLDACDRAFPEDS